MATLTTLNAVSPLDSDDASYATFTLAQANETQTFALDNVDTDFATMDTLTWVVQASLTTALDNDTYDLDIRIMNGATVMAAADGTGTWVNVVTGLSTTTDTNYGSPTAFAYVNASNKTTWDGASVELRSTINKTKGWDTAKIRVDIVTFDGTYTASAGGSLISASMAGEGGMAGAGGMAGRSGGLAG